MGFFQKEWYKLMSLDFRTLHLQATVREACDDIVFCVYGTKLSIQPIVYAFDG